MKEEEEEESRMFCRRAEVLWSRVVNKDGLVS